MKIRSMRAEFLFLTDLKKYQVVNFIKIRSMRAEFHFFTDFQKILK